MKRVCDACGKEITEAYAVENRYTAMRWYCKKCHDAKQREIDELWNLHMIGFRSMEEDD